MLRRLKNIWKLGEYRASYEASRGATRTNPVLVRDVKPKKAMAIIVPLEVPNMFPKEPIEL